MEKAVLKTLLYADIFDYPLKAYEIHKWLIQKKITLRQIEKSLNKLITKKKVLKMKDYYFLPKKKGLVTKRIIRLRQSLGFLRKARFTAAIFQLIPWIQLIGISGGLAMENASKNDDIDLFIITDKNRLWLSRLIVIGILDILRIRRKPKMSSKKVSGKLCLNILLEEDKLSQESRDIFIAHEVLQMKPLWFRGKIYQKYLEDNSWVFKFLPNWTGTSDSSLRGGRKSSGLSSRRGNLYNKKDSHGTYRNGTSLGMTMENLAKWLQLKLMTKPQGRERIEDGALYFHPEDCRLDVLDSYKKRLRFL